MTLGQEIASLRAQLDAVNERARAAEKAEMDSIAAFAESAFQRAPPLDVLQGATVEFVYSNGRWAWKRTIAGKRVNSSK